MTKKLTKVQKQKISLLLAYYDTQRTRIDKSREKLNKEICKFIEDIILNV